MTMLRCKLPLQICSTWGLPSQTPLPTLLLSWSALFTQAYLPTMATAAQSSLCHLHTGFVTVLASPVQCQCIGALYVAQRPLYCKMHDSGIACVS